MCYNFSSTCSLFGANSNVMIALNPKPEKSSSVSHFLICSCILSKLFHITHIAPNITTANCDYGIQKICSKNDANSSADIEEVHKSNCCYDNSCKHNETDNYNCNVKRRILPNRHIFLGKGWISYVEKHSSKSVCEALVTCHKCVRVHGLLLHHIGVHRHHVHLRIGC